MKKISKNLESDCRKNFRDTIRRTYGTVMRLAFGGKDFPNEGIHPNDTAERKGVHLQELRLCFALMQMVATNPDPGSSESKIITKALVRIMLDPLDCHYSGRERAWMDADLMEMWLVAFNEYVERKGRIVILLMDNHSSHKKTVRILAAARKLDSVKVHFLPPNTTSKLQPLDCKFKSGYAKRWLRFLFRCSEKSIDPMKSATMLDALKWGIWAWDEVDADCIYHCWRHTGYFRNPWTILLNRERNAAGLR